MSGMSIPSRCKDCGDNIWQTEEKAVGTGEVQVVWSNGYSWICDETGDEHSPRSSVLSEEPILGDLADYPLTVEDADAADPEDDPVEVAVEVALALVYVRAGNYGEADRRLDRLLRFLTTEDAKED